MKKILLFITFISLAFTGFSQHVFPFDMQVAGDLTIDSTAYLTTLPAVSTSDTCLVLDNGTVKYQIIAANDTSLWAMDTDTTYSKNSGDVRITAGDLYPSADGTYDLGTSTYGWDTLFLSSVIDYGSNLIFSYGGTKAVLTTTGKLGVGDNSPDSAISTTGGKFTTDILVGGGWTNWTPVLTWNAEPTAATVVARYSVVNNTVHFTLDIQGTNDSGSALTTLNITLPITPKDIDAYVPIDALIDEDSKVSYPTTHLVAVIDADDNTAGNRKLYTLNYSIANVADYILIFNGKYEITSK